MKIALILIYVLFILIVIFMERKRPTEALFWVVVTICIPYVGLVLYLVFGSTMAIKMTRKHRENKIKKSNLDFSLTMPKVEGDIKVSEEDKEVANFNYTYSKSKLTSFDDYHFYTDGRSHYEQLFKDIDEAKVCIYIEFYTIHNDVAGHALVDALVKKAKEGIKIFVMIDFIANISTPSKMFRPLRKAGGKVVRIKPFLTHYRSHRKIVVIDHNISYIGGMNIGKKYINLSKKKNPWRDTQIRLTGSCSSILDQYFLSDYICAVRRKDWKMMVEYIKTLEERENVLNNNLCQFVMGGVSDYKASIKMSYLSLIRSAKKRIRIQSPYFVPDGSILDALKTAIASGVEVELMLPGVSSSFFLDPVTTYYVGELLEYGAKIYKYHGYVHAKTMLIDDEICVVGSVNLDIRSLLVDDEICGIFYENSLVQTYSEIYDKDIKSTDLYTFEEFNKRGNLEKIREYIFLLFAPLM